MKQVEWSEEARTEIREIIEHIASDNPYAADRVEKRIHGAISRLRYFNSGRLGRVEGTFEKLVPKTNYIIAYSLRRSKVFILHIIHAARNWPKGRWPD